MRRSSALVLLALLLVLLTTFGCAQKKPAVSDSPKGSEGLGLLPPGSSESQGPQDVQAGAQLGAPSDYFPTTTGTKWVYQITTGPAEPFNYHEVAWPKGDGMAMRQAVRGRFVAVVSGKAGKTCKLSLSVKGPAAKTGPLQYPESVELQVNQDDLGVFEDSSGVFWAITHSGRYDALLVVTYSPSTPGAPTGQWGSWGEDGYSLRNYFFGDQPGLSISLGEDGKDSLVFIGPEANQLHFQRVVEADTTDTESVLNKPFTEDMWFEKGKGLVLLEQKVDSKTSMKWKLIQFVPGRG